MPGYPWLALSGAALLAFLPTYMFISSVINNDIAAACLCTWGLYLCIRLVRHPARLRTSLFLGIVLGLALLSKMSALALPALAALALAANSSAIFASGLSLEAAESLALEDDPGARARSAVEPARHDSGRTRAQLVSQTVVRLSSWRFFRIAAAETQSGS